MIITLRSMFKHRGLGQSWVGGAEQRTGLAASPASVFGGLALALGGLTSVILFNPWMRASVLALYGEGNGGLEV